MGQPAIGRGGVLPAAVVDAETGGGSGWRGVGGEVDLRETAENKVDGLGLRLMEASASQVEGIMERGPTEDGYQLELIIPPDAPKASD